MEREEGSSNGFQMHQESRSGGMLISTNHLPGSTRTARPVRDNDHYMPIANIIRIMRRILPNQAKISDDAKETIQECVSEYITFITGEANERCQREQRKTITADDILWAMNKLGFKEYVRPLSMFLHRYRELETDHTHLLVGPARGSSATNGVLSLFLKQQSSCGGEMDHLVHLGAAGGISNDTVSSSDYVPFHHQLMTTSQQLGVMGTYLVDGSVIVNQAPASQHHQQQVAIASSDNVAYNDQYYKY